MNKDGQCKARFPRPIVEQTQVDPKTGALNMKKGEAWVNTFTPVVTYLLRCNSDITSLLSGTAIKAIVAYVSDYITKPGLKTYSIFDTIRSVFDRNSEMLGGSLERKEKTRRLMTQIVNTLTAKLEIGGPMASLYLLGNPDHYTSHKFIPVYWKNYVKEVLKSWDTTDVDYIPEKAVIQKARGAYVLSTGILLRAEKSKVGVELRYGSEVEGRKRSSGRTLASACKKLRPAQNYVVPISKEVGNVGDVGVSRSLIRLKRTRTSRG